MTTMHVKPAPGAKVRYPDAPDRLLPAEGAEVPASAYWMRRLKDGSVDKITAARAAAAAKEGGK